MNQLMSEFIFPSNDLAIAPNDRKKNSNYRVDWAELFNEYENTSEPKAKTENALSEFEQVITLIHVLPSELEAQNALKEMQRQGLSSNQIEIVAKHSKSLYNSLSWDRIAEALGWSSVVSAFGISTEDTWKFVEALENGKYLILAIVRDRAANQVQHILKNIGHSVIAVY